MLLDCYCCVLAEAVDDACLLIGVPLEAGSFTAGCRESTVVACVMSMPNARGALNVSDLLLWTCSCAKAADLCPDRGCKVCAIGSSRTVLGVL